MKWKATADVLVGIEGGTLKKIDGEISWEIEANTIEEAVNIACTKARKSGVADTGSLDLVLIEEDKNVLTEKIFEFLHYTKANQNIVGLDYNERTGEVIIIYKSGHVKYVDVNHESGADMAREVLRAID